MMPKGLGDVFFMPRSQHGVNSWSLKTLTGSVDPSVRSHARVYRERAGNATLYMVYPRPLALKVLSSFFIIVVKPIATMLYKRRPLELIHTMTFAMINFYFRICFSICLHLKNPHGLPLIHY